MKWKVLLQLLLILGLSQPANAAWLRMQWRGLGPDDAEIQLAPGEPAVIDIYYEMTRPEDTLAALSFRNSEVDVEIITQTTTEALLPGWDDHSVGSTPGWPDHIVDWEAAPGFSISGPGEFLIGSQSIQHSYDTAGAVLPITFAFGQMNPVDDAGTSYTYAPDLHLIPGLFGVGLGKPQTPGIYAKDSNPLFIVTVPEPSGLGLLILGVVLVPFQAAQFRV